MIKFILILSALLPLTSNSQVTRYVGSSGTQHNLQLYDITGEARPINDYSNPDGTPLLQDEWTFGIIILNNGNILSDSSINYSLTDDKLFFKRSNFMYPINYPVKEFLIEGSGNFSKKTTYDFQNGFPSINGNDSLTFYEVLFNGNFLKLLKRQHKAITENYTYNGPHQNEYSLKQTYFVFFKKRSEMVYIGMKPTLKMLIKKLDEYSNQIQSYNSVLKTDDDLIRLFSALDSVNLK